MHLIKRLQNPNLRVDNSESFHFGFGGGGAFVGALAGLEVVDDVEGKSPAVVALAFVDEHAAGVHGPVVVCRVEYVGGCQLDGQRFVKECLTD